MKICFMGTPQIAATVLINLLKHFDIHSVYTKPPKEKNRGLKLHISKVHEVAVENNIPVYHPKNFKKEVDVLDFQKHNFDLAIVVAYGLILPKAIFAAPKFGTLNLHGSLLPKWRGAAPIERCIEAGDTKTGPTIMYIEEGLDSGNIIYQEEFPILSTTTSREVYANMAEVGSKLIIKAINNLKNGQDIPSIPQDHSQATYAKMLKKEEGKLNFYHSAISIINKINAFTIFPGSYFIYKNEIFKIIKATIANKKTIGNLYIPPNIAPSQIFTYHNNIYITTATDLIKIEILQRAGKKALNAKDFLMGYQFNNFDTLE